MADIHLELKAKLEKQRDQLQAELAESGTPPADGMGYGTHQADDGTVAFEQAADLAMRENARRMLYQVERALFRMEKGTFGICQRCNEKIEVARLKAIPYTRYCLHCASVAQE
ncbi:MAG: TraR/DksA C4-type zinc finger protein [Anaerolineae bacterium]|nr:TraR/DksA C4-type zinc finger protein [Anaerolineae bacterium]